MQPGMGPAGMSVPPPPPAPEPPSPRISCPDCDFSFIVGEVAVAPCPNCGVDVETGHVGSVE